jgi:hypothetical protein
MLVPSMRDRPLRRRKYNKSHRQRGENNGESSIQSVEIKTMGQVKWRVKLRKGRSFTIAICRGNSGL